MAERYVLWIKNIIDQGLWSEALAALERASDFADVSSDISYLLALARYHENKSRNSVLEALEQALVIDRWNLYRSEAARLLKAEILIALRAYPQALTELSMVNRSPREAELTLKALCFFRPEEFRRFMAETLDRYPRESGPVRIFFSFLK
jgi:tetratricopeptide (TPR) repeat protein